MCGIFGIINQHPDKFNYSMFSTLGIHNDSRGGDSVGIFIDGQVEYGVDDNKLFSNFFRKSLLLQNTTKCKVAIGHTRKASVGAKTIAEAQPVVIEKNGKIEFVMMHNGTLLNYKELAKELIPDVDITGMTDSYVLAHIIYNTGFEVLEDYLGAAALCIIDYRHNSEKVFVYKGMSKESSYSKEASVERPLYVGYYNGTMYFSSLPAYLFTIHKTIKIYDITPNVVFDISKGTFDKVHTVDRSDKHQKDYTITRSYGETSSDATSIAQLYWDEYESAYFGYENKSVEDSIGMLGYDADMRYKITTNSTIKIAHGKFYIDSNDFIYNTFIPGRSGIAFINGVRVSTTSQYLHSVPRKVWDAMSEEVFFKRMIHGCLSPIRKKGLYYMSKTGPYTGQYISYTNDIINFEGGLVC